MATITRRSADMARTMAAIVDMVAHGRCNVDDLRALMVRDEDPMYLPEVTRCLLLSMLNVVDSFGIEHGPEIQWAEIILATPLAPAATPPLYFQAAHKAAHIIVAIHLAAYGADDLMRRSRQWLDAYATDNFGDGIEVER